MLVRMDDSRTRLPRHLDDLRPPIEPIQVARLEERRRMLGVSMLVAEYVEIAGGRMCYDGPASWANSVIAAGLDVKPTASTAHEIIAFYTERDEPAAVELCPFTDDDFVKSLSAERFVIKNFENVLSASTEPWADFAVSSPPQVRLDDGRVIEIVPLDPADDREVDAFVRVVMSGFVPPGLTEPPDTHLRSSKKAVQHPSTRSFAARLDGGCIVAGGSLGLHPELDVERGCPPGVGALFGVTVLPEFRRLGIQQLLIAARLASAARSGCGLATIQSIPGISTERNAMRLGFQVAYTNVTVRRPI